MPSTLSPHVTRYIRERRARGEITAEHARNTRAILLDFATSHGKRPLDQLGTRSVERWLEAMTKRGYAPSTRALRLSALRVFARWLVVQRIVDRDFTLGVAKVRRPRSQPRDVTNEHAEAVLAQARTSRERLIFWLMFGAGLRCVEVARLDVDDWDRSESTVFVTGKGGHQRTVPIGPSTTAALDAYLAETGNHAGALIRSEDGTRRLSRGRIGGIVGRMFADAGVKLRPYDGRSAHGLRAAAASDLYDVLPDPRVVQEFLGHADMQNLERYLRRARLDRVAEGQQARWKRYGDAEHVARFGVGGPMEPLDGGRTVTT